MNFKITKQWTKKFLLMITSVMLMGFSVSLPVLTDMGTDPCPAMNYGISAKIGMSFGTYQLLLNAVLLVFVLIFDLFAMLIGVITKGEAGLITALMVISLGPAVAYIGELFKKRSVI